MSAEQTHAVMDIGPALILSRCDITRNQGRIQYPRNVTRQPMVARLVPGPGMQAFRNPLMKVELSNLQKFRASLQLTVFW